MATDNSMLDSSNSGDSGPRTSTDSCASSTLSTSSLLLLDRLQAPRPSELSRKRRVHTHPPPRGKRRSSASSGDSATKSVGPLQRTRECPGEELTVADSKLFCIA